MQKRKVLIERKKFIISVRHAYRGIQIAFREEQNIRIHILCAIAVFFFALLFRVNGIEFMMLSFSVTLVIAIELVNSIVERFSDMLRQEASPLIAAIKDMSAGAVFLCALNACVIGGMIFFHKIIFLVQVLLFGDGK